MSQNLKSLDLSNNYLLNITSTSFVGLTGLLDLDLSFNRIEFIEANSFISLFNLQVVYLTENPIALKQPDYVKKLCSLIPTCTICLTNKNCP